jgi:hypothetical protein
VGKTTDLRLDERLLWLLGGQDLESKVGTALQLITVGSDARAHTALLSVGEVVAVTPELVRLATWSSSTTTRNLRRNPRALLATVVDGTYYSVQLSASPYDGPGSGAHGLALFAAGVESVESDDVSYAQVLSGITYRLLDPEPVLARWRSTVELLLHADQPSVDR